MPAKFLSMPTLAILAATAFIANGSAECQASDPYAAAQVWQYNYAASTPWHGGYYQQQYRQPLALVVPPTAHMRSTYSWGVSQNTIHNIPHQYGRSANVPGRGPLGLFRPTPIHPSHTDQYGMYYVRGPW